MKCSSSQYRTLIKPEKWSVRCSPLYDYQVSDLVNFMLACKKIYHEFEPLLWSGMKLAAGLPQFGIFFKRYLTIPLRSRFPELVPRAEVLQKMIVALPRSDKLASEMGRDLRYYHLPAYGHVRDKIEQSLIHLTRYCPQLSSVMVIIDAAQLEPPPDPADVIAYARSDIEIILRFHDLKSFAVLHSGPFSGADTRGVKSIFKKQLEICQEVARDMVTGTAAPLEAQEDYPEESTRDLAIEYDKPELGEYCERVARTYRTWWMGISEEQKTSLLNRHTESEELRNEAAEMSTWMLENQI